MILFMLTMLSFGLIPSLVMAVTSSGQSNSAFAALLTGSMPLVMYAMAAAMVASGAGDTLLEQTTRIAICPRRPLHEFANPFLSLFDSADRMASPLPVLCDLYVAAFRQLSWRVSWHLTGRRVHYVDRLSIHAG